VIDECDFSCTLEQSERYVFFPGFCKKLEVIDECDFSYFPLLRRLNPSNDNKSPRKPSFSKGKRGDVIVKHWMR